MSGVIDTFGPMLDRALSDLHTNLDQATRKNARLLQAGVTKGIRDQKWASLWRSLKPGTILRKMRHGLDPRTLIEGDRKKSEDLWKSFEVVKIESGVYEVGSNAPYARAHELGYEAGGIPARPYFQPALQEAEPQMVENWKDAVKHSFGG